MCLLPRHVIRRLWPGSSRHRPTRGSPTWLSSAALETLKGRRRKDQRDSLQRFVPNSMSPAKPGSSEKAGGIASCYGRGRLPSDLTFLRLGETSTLILSRHGQHLKLDSAKSNLVIVPGDSPSDSVNGVRFSADGYDQLIQCAAEQLNQVRERQLSGLRHGRPLCPPRLGFLRRAETRSRLLPEAAYFNP